MSLKEKFRKLLLQESRKQWDTEIANLGEGFVAPFRVTPQEVIDTCIQKLNLNSKDLLFDLGCGEGHWCVAASKSSGCKSVGIELSEEIANRARISVDENHLSKLVDIHVKDMLSNDGLLNIHEASVVIVYCGRDATKKLAPILKKNLRHGTRVISVHFAIPGWPTVDVYKHNKAKVYYYTIGSNSCEKGETKISPPPPLLQASPTFSTSPTSTFTPASWTNDIRIDPSIRAAWATLPAPSQSLPPVPKNRKECLKQASEPLFVQSSKAMSKLFGSTPLFAGMERVQPSEGFETTKSQFTSLPEGNIVKVNIIRRKQQQQQQKQQPQTQQNIPIVIYFHGGGMAKASCFDQNFQTFGRMIASNGVIVVMVDFRNSTVPSREGEPISPYPGGLNDCVSSVRWVVANRSFVGGSSQSRVILAGESGGGNLSIAAGLKLKDVGEISLIHGIYAMCPFISGNYNVDANGLNAKYPSISKYTKGGFGGIVLTNEFMQTCAVGYGDNCRNDKYAWPSNCTQDDIHGLCPITISLNEFDPLIDEGKEFYRKCLQSNVDARCIIVQGTVHATDSYFVGTHPRVSRATACAIASFAKGIEEGKTILQEQQQDSSSKI
jgi:acetyl esterase